MKAKKEKLIIVTKCMDP